MGSVAMLGSTLVPEMEKRGYKKPMSLGPILGSGGLAMMIPPSGLAIFLGAIAEVSIGRLLIAIIIPGLMMAVLYATYIITRCKLQPSIAPPYDVPPTPILGKLVATVRYILPLTFIVFMVVGVIFLGVASPTEAAATGAIGMFLLAAAYRQLNWVVVKSAIAGTVKITGMIFLIIASAAAFSQILAASGATQGMIDFVMGLPLTPIFIILAMQVVFLFMGMFMTSASMVMIAIPIFMPIVRLLGFDTVWFAVIVLLNMEMAQTSPPFGATLFVMKGVAPPDTTMGSIYRAALPFLYCDLIAMTLIIIFPQLAIWLPGLMR
jgi:tripartite ATP-independent transporter DctM subunit